MEEVYISLGSNLEDRLKNIKKAIHYISLIDNTHLECYSSVYETEPVGIKETENNCLPFMNCVIKIKTQLTCFELLDKLENIEKKLGRKFKKEYKSRTIDLDILFYGNLTIENEKLKIPHPRLYEREFVLIPLLEVLPQNSTKAKAILELINKNEKLVGKIIKNYGYFGIS